MLVFQVALRLSERRCFLGAGVLCHVIILLLGLVAVWFKTSFLYMEASWYFIHGYLGCLYYYMLDIFAINRKKEVGADAECEAIKKLSQENESGLRFLGYTTAVWTAVFFDRSNHRNGHPT